MKLIAPYKCRYNQRPVSKGDCIEVLDRDVEHFKQCGWVEPPKPKLTKTKKQTIDEVQS